MKVIFIKSCFKRKIKDLLILKVKLIKICIMNDLEDDYVEYFVCGIKFFCVYLYKFY